MSTTNDPVFTFLTHILLIEVTSDSNGGLDQAAAPDQPKGDLFSSMKNQMSGLSSLFGKKEAKETTEEHSTEQVKSPVKDVVTDPSSDKSIGEEVAAGTEEGFGLEEVSNKAMQGARSIGSFFASAVSKAGKTVTEAGSKIKKTVEESVRTIIDNFFFPLTYFFLYFSVDFVRV
jgi:hypothetical protein